VVCSAWRTHLPEAHFFKGCFRGDGVMPMT
jgi:hypothetical protein